MKADLSLYDGMPGSSYLNVKSLSSIFNLTTEMIYYHVKKGNIPPPDVENGRYTLDQSCAHNINKKKKDRFKHRRRLTKKWKLGTLREFKIKLDKQESE